tara:strand:+ start:413 stop:547 length:135 start_codon:yes stop_codon:yes gene_type:complete
MEKLIMDIKTNTYKKFIWYDKEKYIISLRALNKAQKENKIKIIY